jgi:hypothetical protein
MSTSQFGRARPAGRLLAARSLVYLQAGILVLGAGWMGVVLVTAGNAASTAFPMQGVIDHANVSGAGVAVLAILNLVMAAAVVFLAREAERSPEGYRTTFAALEIGIAIYLIGFIGTAVGDVLFGPVLAVILIAIHWWPELDARLLGGGSSWTATPSPSSPGALLEATATPGAAEPVATALPEGLASEATASVAVELPSAAAPAAPGEAPGPAATTTRAGAPAGSPPALGEENHSAA